MFELYKRIEELAKNNGMTVNSLQLKAGVSQTTLSELKSGRTQDISRKTAEKLSKALNITVDKLYGVTNDVTPFEQIQDELFEKRKMLVELSKKMSEKDLDILVKIAKALVNDIESGNC